MAATLNPPANSIEPTPRHGAAIEHVHRDLDALVSRLRREILLGGAMAVMSAAFSSLLAMLVVDAVMQPDSTWVRLALWAPAIGIVSLVTRRYLLRPLRTDCGRFPVAWSLEQKRPEIEERLTTSLQLAEASNARNRLLIEAVAEQARGSIAGCQEKDLKVGEWWRSISVAGACFTVFVLSIWTWSPYLIPALRNVLNPWNTRVHPHLNATIDPGSTHVGEGADLLVTATGGQLNHAVLEVIENDFVLASHPMAVEEMGKTARFLLTGLTSDRKYRVRAGGLFSDEYDITIDSKPVIEKVEVSLAFPDYTQLDAVTLDDLSEPFEVIQGTQIRLNADATLRGAETSLVLNGLSNPCVEIVAAEQPDLWRHRWEFAAAEVGEQQGIVALASDAGVESDPFPLEMRVIPDLAPAINIDQPAIPEATITPAQKVAVAFHAFDDFGIGAIQLITQKNADPPIVQQLSIEAGSEIVGETIVDSKEMDLTVGDQLHVWLNVTDNRPDAFGGAQSTDSRKIHILIRDEAASVGEQVVRHEEQQLLAGLAEALNGLEAAEQTASEIQADLDNGKIAQAGGSEASDTLQKSKQLQERIKRAERGLRRLSEQSEQDGNRLLQPEIERIEEVANREVADAKKQAGLIPLSDDSNQQLEAAMEARQSLSEAINRLEEIREDVEERAERLQLAARLDELAQQQEQLARELNNAAEEGQQAQQQKKQREQQKQQQEQVANALQEIVEQDLDRKSEQFARRAEEAAKLTEAAAALQEQQQALAELEQARSPQELKDQLLNLIAKQQDQVADDARSVQPQSREAPTKADDEQKPAKPNKNDAADVKEKKTAKALDEARKQMEAASEKLRQRNLEQAESAAHDAGQNLQSAQSSMPESEESKNRSRDSANRSETSELEGLAKQQERVRDAIKAVREERSDEAIEKLQEQIAERTEQLRDKADALLQLPTEDQENRRIVQEARKKVEQARRETRASEEVAKDRRTDSSVPKQASEQKMQAAKSLQEATQSLEMVCKSCQKCSNCSRPGESIASSSGSGGSTNHDGNASEPNPSEPKRDGDQPQAPKRGSKSGESGKASPRAQQPDSQKLAETADKAHQAARSPSPNGARELARDLNQLAVEAAKQAGYPKRNSNPDDVKSGAPNPTGSSQQAGMSSQGNPSQPAGAMGKDAANQTGVASTQLRGRSTSNWTQSRRMLQGNVLDNENSKIPEEFRGVVRDYFEELSRLEPHPGAEEVQK